MIVQKDGKWVVMDSKGNKVLGTHSSKKEAEGQLTAIHISQKKKSFKDHLEEAASLTLQYHDELNPKFWENDRLKEEVREKLLEIADAWIEFAQIPTEAVVDVLFVGGNANYNYTNYSDIDVHILIDKDKMPDCPDLLDEYLKNKKQLWSLIHDITVYDHDVELYAQDINEATPSDQGVYSLADGEWKRHPEKQEANLDDPHIKQKVDYFTQKIDSLITSNAEDESFGKLKNKFKNMRNSALKKGGELSVENLVFKELRNLGYLDKMNDYIQSKQDKSLSL
ncbi:MAG: Synechococcus phage [Bacteroidota bacterium]|jgi:hypothetical protein